MPNIVSFFDQFPEYEGRSVEIRGSDGYVSVTDLNGILGKRFTDWRKTAYSKDLLDELSKIYRIPIDLGESSQINSKALVHREFRGGREGNKIYVHPAVAIAYCSSNGRFMARVSAWVANMAMNGAATIHVQDWTAMEYLRGVEFSRDDIREMYG